MNSYWLESTQNKKNNSKIDKNYITDVCIIGAGICGLTTGYYLAKEGLKVIVIDKANIGEKVSGHTTAKITSQHNLIYDYLINSFGIDFAFKYLDSNQKAIENIKKIIDSENIECDFEYQNNYVYTTLQDELPKIHNELKALNILNEYLNSSKSQDFASHKINSDFSNTKNNINNSSFPQFVTTCGLPFKISGAIESKNQAMFHPRKYMLGLAKAITSYGGLIFTDSTVTDVKKSIDNYDVFINDYIIQAKNVVLASHYPFINFPGLYFSKMYKSTSYAIAIDTHNKIPEGMYINCNKPTFSFRPLRTENRDLLIIAGGDHKTGYAPNDFIPDDDIFDKTKSNLQSVNTDSTGYQVLEQKAKELYPNCDILYKWDTSDCISLDKIPYIGNFSNLMPNIYVATGFNKWGITSSNVAANIIKDKILRKQNKYADIYDSTRLQPIKNRGEVKNMVSQIFKSFISNRIQIPEEDLSAIKKGNGGIIKINGTDVGIYKDLNGDIYAVDPTCTHLGCLLTWNNLDKTWDCPCHGSRFDFTGKNIYDPAVKNLGRYNVEN